jgi:Domain of unknown function (DUF3459)
MNAFWYKLHGDSVFMVMPRHVRGTLPIGIVELGPHGIVCCGKVRSRVTTQEMDSNSVLNFYRKAIKFRQQSAALRSGSIEFLEATETLLVIRRQAGEELVTCVYNFGEDAVEVPEADKGKRILVTECTSETLLPFGFAWSQ